MPVTVVVGGQFGGEGKGKVSHFLAQDTNVTVAIRVGGSNSGHTVIGPSGSSIILRQLSTLAILPNVACVLGAGSYIDPDILFDEVSRTGLSKDRLFIDPNAMVVTNKELLEEKNSSLRENIGSTLSGTGAAVIRRISRDSFIILAKDNERLKPFVRPVVPFLRERLSRNERIIIEGTQGFGLSLLHSEHYPYVTSRDTTAATFVSEAGLSPLDVDDVVMVIRTFPIRVGGNSGPLPNETTWETITKESGIKGKIMEHTSVTKTVRRVGLFDPTIVRKAIEVNRPTRIVLNHLDYIDCRIVDGVVTNEAIDFINYVESSIEQSLDFIGVCNSKLCNRNLFVKGFEVK